MQTSYKVEEVSTKKSGFRDVILPIFLVVMTFVGIVVISAISFFFGLEQGKNQKTSPMVPFITQAHSPTPTPTVIPIPTLTGNKKMSPTVTPIPKTSIITSSKEIDGYISSNNYVNKDSEIRAGRNKFIVSRGFLSFDLSKLPKYSKILSVTLRIYQTKTVGNPFGSETGNLMIDHLTIGESLDEPDYNANSLSSNFEEISKNRSVGWKEAEVSNPVIEDLGSNRKLTQFRLHFEKEEKGTTDSGDYAYFESSDNSEGTTNIPQLLVKYY